MGETVERSSVIEWMFPPRCPVCFRPVMPKGALVHRECERKLQYLQEPICKKCGRPVEPEEEYCAECMVTASDYDEGRSVFPYHGVAGRCIRRVKREGTEEFVRFFGIQMAASQRGFLIQIKPECIVPVPLHYRKLRRRGFNQAELLARALSRETGIPVRLLLKKTKRTKEQKKLTGKQRRKNVSHSYSVAEAAIRNKVPESVLLLDDIVTTGSTLNACASALKEAGVAKVFYLTVCAADAADGG